MPALAEPERDVKPRVVEDDNVRIEELRVRGQVQQIIVRNKRIAAPEYRILVPRGGQDPSKDRDASGQRVWQLLSF